MLRPTFLSFETAKRALSSSQLGLDTVGHNISNVNTAGYTRQRIDQVSISSSGYKAKYQAFGSFFPGQGSDVIGISQIRDPYLDRRYRTEAAISGQYAAISDGLEQVNAIFDEIMTTGNHAKMGDFLTQLDRLIESADSKEQSAVLRNKAEQVAQVLNKNSIDLDNTEVRVREELGNAINDVNKYLEQIAYLNVKIKEDNFYGNPANELNDERNLLVDQLSELIDIDVKQVPIQIREDQTILEYKIELHGSGNEAEGIPPVVLVDSGAYNGLKMKIDGDTGEASVALIEGISQHEIAFDQGNGVVSSDITSMLLTGAVKGHLNILNGQGEYAAGGENGFRGIPYYRAALDDYAAHFAEVMNRANRLAVMDNTTTPPTTSYIERPLFISSDANNPTITAANIAVSSEWRNNPQYIETATVNNALYAPGGVLHLRGDDGNLTAVTDFTLAQVSSVDVNGYLVDADGNQLLQGGEKVNISQLQRAMTETTTYRPWNLDEFTNQAAAPDPNSGKLMIKINGQEYTTDTVPADVAGYDKSGNLLDAAGNQITYTINPGTKDAKTISLNKNNLHRTVPQGPGTEYHTGEMTPNELLPGVSENDNLLDLKLALTSDITFRNGYTGNFQEYMTNFQGDMALDKELNDTLFESSYKVLSGLADSRDSVSAVSIDEEGINMMTFQNYYNAAARYMTVLDEALGTIIQGMGVVGR